MTLFILLLAILLLILLTTWVKFNAFLAFLVVAIVTGLLLGISAGKVIRSVEHGIGDTLGAVAVIIALGAMLGKLVAESGAAQTIADVLMRLFGRKYIQWALMITGFIVGIPLFYNVGFVLVVPLIFAVVYEYKLPAVYVGLPMLASLSVTHGFLPPHPSPAGLVVQLKADMGQTLLYGLMIALPAVVLAGPLFSRFFRGMEPTVPHLFQPAQAVKEKAPGVLTSFLSSLLPVFLLAGTTLLRNRLPDMPGVQSVMAFVSEPVVVMLLSLITATYTLGIAMGKTMGAVTAIYGEAVKDVSMILLIVGGSGALKQVLSDSGVSGQIAAALLHWPVHPLVLGWLMAAIIRVCLGSATIAGLTAAGLIAPVVLASHVNPSLMVLAVGAGSLMFSHVNDTGFWMFKEYFNLSIKDTLKSWSVMESIVSLTGLAGVLVLHACLG